MTPTDNLQSNQQLTSLVADLTHLLETFLDALQAESEALKKNHSEQLSLTSSTKESKLEAIATSTNLLESNLKAYQLTLSDLFEADLSSKLPQPLQQDIKRLAQLSNNCQDLNQANGMAIQILSNINSHAINLISGKEPSGVKLYGSSGISNTSSKTKKSLGKA
jgi:flagellar biosynthesis/type III secretory pathway chaperone